ncbi:hypothetical protein D3C87_1516590 [compost metagenome]
MVTYFDQLMDGVEVPAEHVPAALKKSTCRQLVTRTDDSQLRTRLQLLLLHLFLLGCPTVACLFNFSSAGASLLFLLDRGLGAFEPVLGEFDILFVVRHVLEIVVLEFLALDQVLGLRLLLFLRLYRRIRLRSVVPIRVQESVIRVDVVHLVVCLFRPYLTGFLLKCFTDACFPLCHRLLRLLVQQAFVFGGDDLEYLGLTFLEDLVRLD